MNLGDYLISLQNCKRESGVHDCATVPADWAMLQGFSDPIEKWRGYNTEDEAKFIITSCGGLDAVFDDGGLPRRDGDAMEGDIGVIRIAGEDAGSIYTGKRWVFVGNRGIGFATISSEHIVAVWATGNG